VVTMGWNAERAPGCGVLCEAFAYQTLLSIKTESRRLLHRRLYCSLKAATPGRRCFPMLVHQGTIGGPRQEGVAVPIALQALAAFAEVPIAQRRNRP
jgi:hypothetical protein